MNRIPEPELMDDEAQAEAYAAANFSESERLMIKAFDDCFPGANLYGEVIDLGCGPGNMTFPFAERHTNCRITGIDGSAAMLRIAGRRLDSRPDLKERVSFLHGFIPQVKFPDMPFSAIISNSFLHHLHRPELLWEVIGRIAPSGCRILVMDLFRPDSPEQASALVERYAAGEAEILRRDFYLSLLAALTPDEVEKQLCEANLTELCVRTVSDRHMMISGAKT